MAEPFNGRWDDPNMTWDEATAEWDQGASASEAGGTSVIYLNPSDLRIPPRKRRRRDLYWN
jgi:hypothetical protein